MAMGRVKILSFFTGGGLLDLGLEEAGFSIAWTNEVNPAIADMYEAATSGWRKSRKVRPHVAKISSRESIEELRASSILRDAFPIGAPKTFGVVGGPPCPDFSNGGIHNGHEGEHGRLTKLFVDMICQLRPTFFVIENVAGLYIFHKHRKFLDRQIKKLRDDGRYVVDAKVLSALSLGLPQDRERLFVVGFQKRIAERAAGHRIGWNDDGWFSWPSDSKYANAKKLKWPTTSKFGTTPKKPSNIPLELTVYHALNGGGDPEDLPNGLEFFNAYSRKFKTRAEGEVAGKSFKRLHRYRYSPTAWYGNQEVHLHPSKPRRLSVREALRIQTAPDAYVLPDGYSLSAKFKLIGNGVPCQMAKLIGEELADFLKRGTASK